MTRRWIGLDPPAEAVYRTMLRQPRWRTAELADTLGRPEPDIRELINQLRTERLVVRSADDALAYRAVQPALALPSLAATRLKARHRASPGSARPSALPNASAVAGFIAETKRLADARDETRPLRSIDETTAAAERLASTARHEALFLTRRFTPGSFESSRHLIECVLRRGATVRIVCADELAGGPPVVEHLAWLAERGIRPRVAPMDGSHVALVDGATALVEDASGQSWIERRRGAVQVLRAMADSLWKAGAPMPDLVPSAPAAVPRERQEQVLRLLADGLTDAMVARRLGVSVRTVRTDVATTMEALQACSRFQAGARAAQLGLV